MQGKSSTTCYIYSTIDQKYWDPKYIPIITTSIALIWNWKKNILLAKYSLSTRRKINLCERFLSNWQEKVNVVIFKQNKNAYSTHNNSWTGGIWDLHSQNNCMKIVHAVITLLRAYMFSDFSCPHITKKINSDKVLFNCEARPLCSLCSKLQTFL